MEAGVDGISSVDVLLGNTDQGHEFLYWEFCWRAHTFTYPPGWGQAVRLGDWKGIRVNNGRVFLHDLASDPTETFDISNQHPDVAQAIAEVFFFFNPIQPIFKDPVNQTLNGNYIYF